MKKKSMSQVVWIVAALVILLFSTVVLFNVYTYFKYRGDSATDAAICKASLEANARRIEIAGVRTAPFVEPKCNFYDVVITDKYVKGKNKEDQVKKIIADLMTVGSEVQIRKDGKLSDKLVFVPGVWETTMRGEKKLFEEESAKYCLPWAKISFQGDIPPINNFFAYLLFNKIPNSDISYMGYLQNNPDILVEDGEVEGIIDTIDPSGEYALFFTQRTKGHFERQFGVPAAGVALIASAYIGGTVLAMIPEPTITKAVAATLIATAISFTSGAAGYAGGYILGAQFATHEAAVTLVPYDNEKIIDELECEVIK